MSAKFGREFREAHFLFEDGVTELNHGSFGAAPRAVVEAQFEHIRQKHAFSNRYIRFELGNISQKCRKAISEVVDADYHDLVMVPNATTGVNTVLRSYPWQMGDKVVYFSTIYGACLNTLKFLEDQYDIQLIPIELDIPTTKEAITEALIKTLDEHPDTKLVFMDLVSSMPAIMMPWENMVKICRERGVLSFVDGAHGIGIVPISLRTAQPDYFTSNIHKWMYGTTSAAFLYVDPKHHRQVVSLPISAVYISPSAKLDPEEEREVLGNTFEYIATVDYSAMQSVLELVKFRKEVCGGDQAILDYQNKLAKDASQLVCKEFGVQDINLSGDSMAMFTVPFPYNVEPELQAKFISFAEEKFVGYSTFIALAPYKNKVYARFSATIYLDLDDFKVGIDAIRKVIKDWEEAPKDIEPPKDTIAMPVTE